MKNTLNLSALLIANQLDIKAIKSNIKEKPIADSSAELFYSSGANKYEYFFNYGVMAFCGYSDDEIKARVNELIHFCKNPFSGWSRDDHQIRVENSIEPQFEFDQVIVNRIDDKVIRIAMLNLAQSVALDRYHEVTENLLTEIKQISNNLEATGKLKLNRSAMMKFIGRALNTQNEIAENIYVFDAPDLVWYDEYLDKLNHGLTKHFDLRTRFNEIEYTNRIIKDNLSIFREISSQRESNLLEIIIIILILFEVFDLLISKFF